MKVYTQFGLGIKVINGSQLPALAALSLRKSTMSTCNESHWSQSHLTHSSTVILMPLEETVQHSPPVTETAISCHMVPSFIYHTKLKCLHATKQCNAVSVLCL